MQRYTVIERARGNCGRKSVVMAKYQSLWLHVHADRNGTKSALSCQWTRHHQHLDVSWFFFVTGGTKKKCMFVVSPVFVCVCVCVCVCRWLPVRRGDATRKKMIMITRSLFHERLTEFHNVWGDSVECDLHEIGVQLHWCCPAAIQSLQLGMWMCWTEGWPVKGTCHWSVSGSWMEGGDTGETTEKCSEKKIRIHPFSSSWLLLRITKCEWISIDWTGF